MAFDEGVVLDRVAEEGTTSATLTIELRRACQRSVSRSINAFSAVLPTEGRVVGLCWANPNLKNLKETSVRSVSQHAQKSLPRTHHA